MSLFVAKGMVKRFGALLATDHVSFEVAPGQIHALIGPNGAGKSTLVNLVSVSYTHLTLPTTPYV